MRFGDLQLHLVEAGTYWEDGGGLFGLVPRALWRQVMEPDENNRLPFLLRPLLIESCAGKLLVDTGYGEKLPLKESRLIDLRGEAQLLGSLAALGFGPDDIDMVVNTHLHSDHCGGNTQLDAHGSPVPTFPRATYCVQRLEMADAMYPSERTRATYRRENFQPIEQAGRLRLLSGDTRLTDEVWTMVTPGHSRSHQSVIIQSQGRTALYLGDVAPWPIHLERLTWIAAYEADPAASLETKRRLAHWAVENQALLIFDHYPDVAAGYLHRTERPDRFRLEPVAFEG